MYVWCMLVADGICCIIIIYTESRRRNIPKIGNVGIFLSPKLHVYVGTGGKRLASGCADVSAL